MDRHNVLNGNSRYWCSNLDYIYKWRPLLCCNRHPSFDIDKQTNPTSIIVMRINMDCHNVLNGESRYWCSNLNYIYKWMPLLCCNRHPSSDIDKQRNSTLSGKWRKRCKVVRSMYQQEGSQASFLSTDWNRKKMTMNCFL